VEEKKEKKRKEVEKDADPVSPKTFRTRQKNSSHFLIPFEGWEEKKKERRVIALMLINDARSAEFLVYFSFSRIKEGKGSRAGRGYHVAFVLGEKKGFRARLSHRTISFLSGERVENPRSGPAPGKPEDGEIL